MQPVWTIALVVLAFFIYLHLRNRKRRTPEVKVYARRIEGAQVRTFLHPRVNALCLADHGLQFGKGFRRKEGPALPHDGECRCRTVPFSYTSNEVFQGALRKPGPPDASIPGLAEQDAVALLDVLRSWDGAAPPAGAEGALAGVDWTRFSPAHRAALEQFLRERLAFLSATAEPNVPAPA